MQRIVENCQDQNGSRMIQQHFESASDEDREKIFSKVLPEATKLMKDVFGNYVIQKIFEKGSLEQKKALFDALEGEVYNLSVNTYGCRVIQKALEVCDWSAFCLSCRIRSSRATTTCKRKSLTSWETVCRSASKIRTAITWSRKCSRPSPTISSTLLSRSSSIT